MEKKKNNKVVLTVILGCALILIVCAIIIFTLPHSKDIVYTNDTSKITLMEDGTFKCEYLTGDGFYTGTYDIGNNIYVLFTESGDKQVFFDMGDGSIQSNNGDTFYRK